MNYKKVLQVTEHIVLIAIVAGSIGFYLGNQYGHTQVNVSALKTPVNVSK